MIQRRKPIQRRKIGSGTVLGKKTRKDRTKTLSQLKKALDKAFSLYIRNFYANKDGVVYCYTCNRPMTVQTSQCGHFVSRSYLATRWDESNCRPQCAGCNLFGNGRPLDFEENLKKEIGAEAVEAMKASRHKVLKLTPQWYEERIKFYTSLT